ADKRSASARPAAFPFEKGRMFGRALMECVWPGAAMNGKSMGSQPSPLKQSKECLTMLGTTLALSGECMGGTFSSSAEGEGRPVLSRDRSQAGQVRSGNRP